MEGGNLTLEGRNLTVVRCGLQCSTTCGEGQQMRTVVCQAVTKEGWILPGEVREGCNPEERPPFARYCNYGDCRAKYHWNVGPWGEVSIGWLLLLSLIHI